MEIRDAISVTTAFHLSDTTLKRHYISFSLSLSRGIILDSRGKDKKKREKKREKRTVYETALETAKEIRRDCNFKYRIDFLSFLPFFPFFSPI